MDVGEVDALPMFLSEPRDPENQQGQVDKDKHHELKKIFKTVCLIFVVCVGFVVTVALALAISYIKHVGKTSHLRGRD